MQKHVSHFENGFVQRHIPYIEGRVDSVDNAQLIHAIVPRHIETVVLITRGGVEAAG